MNQRLIDEVKHRMAAWPIYSQEAVEDKLVVMKLFHAFGAGTWYLTEYDPEDEQAFGYVTGLGGDEWGYISIRELAELTLRGTHVPHIEIDRYFEPKPFSQINL